MKHKIFLILLPSFLFLAACGGQEEAEPTAEIVTLPVTEISATAAKNSNPLPTETSEPEPERRTDEPAPVPVEEKAQAGETAEPAADPDPTATIEPTMEVESPPETLVVSGQTADGAYFYGNPDAPVILLDYSDFL